MELGGRTMLNGAAVAGAVDLDVFGLEFRKVDTGDDLAVDDEQELVAGERVRAG